MSDSKKTEGAKAQVRIPAPRYVQANCESCEFYEYDEYAGTETCSVNLDEDEMVDFLSRRTRQCPYYRYYDEYKSVHKQI